MLRIPGMRSDDVYWTVALDDLVLLCTSHTHIHRDYWHKGETLEHGCRCTAAAVLLLDCCISVTSTDFVAAGLNGYFCKTKSTALLDRFLCAYGSTYSSTHTYIQKRAHIQHTQRHLSVAVTKECCCCCCCCVAGIRESKNKIGLLMLYSGRESGANTRL